METIIPAIVLWIIALVLLIITFGNTNIDPAIWWFSSASCGLLGLALIGLKQWRRRVTERRESVFPMALEVIQHEIRNFEQIEDAKQTGRRFEGLHQKAVEVDSFEKTAEALNGLQTFWGFGRDCRIALREIAGNDHRPPGEKEVGKLLSVLRVIEAQLVRRGDDKRNE